MTRTPLSETVSFQSVFFPILRRLGKLVEELRHGQDGDPELDDLSQLLETLPITTGEFGLACNRLKNAQRYLASQEHGAARWELDMLRQTIRQRAEAETVSPTNRRKRR